MSTIKHINTKLDTYTSFDDMDLDEKILRGIYSLGFEKPSAIQQKAIVPVIQGRDIIAQAQSGTGKTATFSIGLLHRVDPTKNVPQAIVVADTRELAQQIKKVISQLAQHTDIKIKTCIECGKEITATNVHQKYCGANCRKKANTRSSKKEYVCEVCGKSFVASSYFKRKSCSKKCAYILTSIGRKAKSL